MTISDYFNDVLSLSEHIGSPAVFGASLLFIILIF